ncbi:S41 family peptidase [Polaribacter sp. Asnod1-A03]|uniref:S41 family peptidase n=1 Tax=Polaribacter sp. Asnod1-A03 TaxID=3160581 RepID=UPI0038685D78
MKILTTLSIFLLFTTSTFNAQVETCNCKIDLDFIVSKIKKMPSFKKQIKEEKLDDFNNTYNVISKEMTNPISIEKCYQLLLKQMTLVNDSHSSLTINDAFLPKEILNDDKKLADFKLTATYKNHPKTTKNITDLKTNLATQPLNSLEGIFNYGKQKIGIYFDTNKKDLIGVVLENDLKNWEVGDISFYATKINDAKYNMYQYRLSNKTPRLIKSLSFNNGRILSYKKEGNEFNFELPKTDQKEFEFKQLNENTQYLYFANFSNSKKKALLAFFNNTKDKLTAENIIIDLRSNSGGNKKYSDNFLKYLKNKNVYVITNFLTGSNGEQFTLKLKKLKKTKHLGQTTFGVIAYGINYGRSYTTPTNKFTIMPTDMNFHKYYKYESKGVTPDIKLDYTKDWIDQTLDMIKINEY